MKIQFSLFLFALTFSITYAQDTTRILFIGNSFTYFNNMPQIVKAIADSADIPVITGMHAPGGISVGDTAQGSMAHMNNPALFSLIRSKKWDYTVIQDNQGRFVRDSAVFPGASRVVQGHLNIMDSVKKNNDCAKIILFGGWAWKNGMPPFGNTGIECIQRILVNYCVLNDTMKETIAPIGTAWIKAVNYLPAVNLWDPDDAHPSYAGSYLTASVIFSTIFNQAAKSFSYTGSLSPSVAYNLRAFADTSVFETSFHTRFNLGGVRKLLIQNNSDILTVPGTYQSYAWYKNTILIGTSPAINFTGNGTYRVEVIDNDNCIVKSCNYTELATGLNDLVSEDTEIYPNPVKTGGQLFISGTSWNKVEIVSMAGISEKVFVRKSGEIQSFSLQGLKAGCYILLLQVKEELLRKKIVICD